jgi:Ca2+-binding EF-hand superfamily protein
LKNTQSVDSLRACFAVFDKRRAGAISRAEFRACVDFLLSFPEGFEEKNYKYNWIILSFICISVFSG